MPELSGGGGSGGGVLDPPMAQGLPNASPEDNYALRCLICNVDWPMIPALWDWGDDNSDHLTAQQLEAWLTQAANNKLPCPVCRDLVTFASNLNPIPDEEAFSLKNHADFERYYEDTRGVSADAD